MANPFDSLPTIPCGFQTERDADYVGSDSVALWLHGYAAGVIMTDPDLADTVGADVANLSHVVREICDDSPDAEISSSVLNRLYETMD